MKELEMLEVELKLLQNTIKEVRKYRKDHENSKYPPYQSRVVGELRHRCIALKGTLKKVQGLTTSRLFE